MIAKAPALAILLFVTVTSFAQVDIDIDPAPDKSGLPYFQALSGDDKTIVEFLYLTEKAEFCSAEIDFVTVCVFDHPFVEGAQYLYVNSGNSVLVLYEEHPIAVLLRSGIANLPDGQYQVLDIDVEYDDDNRFWEVETIFTFRIGEADDDEEGDGKESELANSE